MNKKNKKIVYGALAGLVLAGIGYGIISSMEEKCQDSRVFIGQTYVAKGENNTPIIINFDKASMSVTGQVINRYFGNYDSYCNNFSFGEIATTRMMGPKDAMMDEERYFNFLSTVKSYKIKGDDLILIGDKKYKFTKAKIEDQK